jgi:hypothetical protein
MQRLVNLRGLYTMYEQRLSDEDYVALSEEYIRLQRRLLALLREGKRDPRLADQSQDVIDRICGHVDALSLPRPSDDLRRSWQRLRRL